MKGGRVTACDAEEQLVHCCGRSYDCGGAEGQLQCDGGSLGECRRVVGVIVVADVCGAGQNQGYERELGTGDQSNSRTEQDKPRTKTRADCSH